VVGPNLLHTGGEDRPVMNSRFHTSILASNRRLSRTAYFPGHRQRPTVPSLRRHILRSSTDSYVAAERSLRSASLDHYETKRYKQFSLDLFLRYISKDYACRQLHVLKAVHRLSRQLRSRLHGGYLLLCRRMVPSITSTQPTNVSTYSYTANTQASGPDQFRKVTEQCLAVARSLAVHGK